MITKGIEAIFDLDGTLIDSSRKIDQDIVEAFGRLGVKITREQVHGRDWKELSEKYGIPYEALDKELDKRKTWQESLENGEVEIFPETLEVLDYLKRQGVQSSILTMSIPEYTEQKLNHFPEIRGYMDLIETVHPNVRTKVPIAKEMVSQILKSRNPERVYFIGDRTKDLEPIKTIEDIYQKNTRGIWIKREGLSEGQTPYKTSVSGSLNALIKMAGVN